MDKIDKQIDVIINLINNEIDLESIKLIDNKFDNNDELKSLISTFNELKQEYLKTGIITDDLIKVKQKLYNENSVREYLDNFSKLNIISNYYCQKMNDITNNKVCSDK